MRETREKRREGLGSHRLASGLSAMALVLVSYEKKLKLMSGQSSEAFPIVMTGGQPKDCGKRNCRQYPPCGPHGSTPPEQTNSYRHQSDAIVA